MACPSCDERYDGDYCDDAEECGCACHCCFICGELHCPGYCDDYQTYNMRPGETGG
jgi:hypothetical protein